MEDLIIIGILALLLSVGITSGIKHFKGQSGCCGGSAPAKKKKLRHVLYKKIMVIEGMSCENCKNRVERVLNDLEDVACVVDLKRNTAMISLGKEIEDQILISVVEKAGYKVIELK